MEYSKQIGKILSTLSINQTILASKLGVSRGIVSEFASGAREPSKEFLLGLSKTGISLDWFLTGEGDMFLNRTPEGSPFIKQTLGGGPPGSVLGYAPPGVQHNGAVTQILQGSPAPRESQKIPLLRQKVSCGPGENWESEENIAEYLAIDTLIPHLSISRIFALRAHGSSMLGVGIHGGDYVLFDAGEDQGFRDGIYVFALDGDMYCKRLEFDGLAQTVKIFSVRSADLEKAELLKTLNIEDSGFTDRFRIFGKVSCWIHPNMQEE